MTGDSVVPLNRALFDIFDSSTPGSLSTLRSAAKRIDALTTDKAGMLAIPAPVAEAFKRNVQEFGRLMPRGCKSISQLLEGAES